MTITLGEIRAGFAGRQRAFGITGAETRMMQGVDDSAVRFYLARNAVMSVHPEKTQEETIVRCLSGSLWITQEDDSRDYFLKAGEVYRTAHPSRIVLQAMKSETIASLA